MMKKKHTQDQQQQRPEQTKRNEIKNCYGYLAKVKYPILK